mmetsp:Transcript_36933/g.114971  ORF Transcript_36933/g.114971 Transcript_36933/m.114971 type:complete len:216 (-) Transcript_36933:364-1011(-)
MGMRSGTSDGGVPQHGKRHALLLWTTRGIYTMASAESGDRLCPRLAGAFAGATDTSRAGQGMNSNASAESVEELFGARSTLTTSAGARASSRTGPCLGSGASTASAGAMAKDFAARVRASGMCPCGPAPRSLHAALGTLTSGAREPSQCSCLAKNPETANSFCNATTASGPALAPQISRSSSCKSCTRSMCAIFVALSILATNSLAQAISPLPRA